MSDDRKIQAEMDERGDDFAATIAVRAVNQKLKDGIIGVVERALNVMRQILRWCWRMLVHIVADGLPWLFRMLWEVVKFVFGKRMRNFLWENLLLVVLFPFFIAVLIWPFGVYCYLSPRLYWLWIGWGWFLVIGCVGAWIGLKNGAFAKLREKYKAWRSNKKKNSTEVEGESICRTGTGGERAGGAENV